VGRWSTSRSTRGRAAFHSCSSRASNALAVGVRQGNEHAAEQLDLKRAAELRRPEAPDAPGCRTKQSMDTEQGNVDIVAVRPCRPAVPSVHVVIGARQGRVLGRQESLSPGP